MGTLAINFVHNCSKMRLKSQLVMETTGYIKIAFSSHSPFYRYLLLAGHILLRVFFITLLELLYACKFLSTIVLTAYTLFTDISYVLHLL